MAQLNGRVFTRLQQYDALPAELKDEVERLEQYLMIHQSELFESHHTLALKSVYGVKVRALLDKIEDWLKANRGTQGREAVAGAGAAGVNPSQPSTAYLATTTDAAAADTAKGALHHGDPAGKHAMAQTATTNTTTTTPMAQGFADPMAGSQVSHAHKLLNGLVLKGFVTPDKEDKPDDSMSAAENLEFKDGDLLVPRVVDVAMAKNAAPTVWDLVDGAIFAGMLKRKAGLLEPLTHTGKDTYVMVNSRLKNLTLFASDLGREPIVQMAARHLKVAFDNSHYENGLKVWNDTDSELLDGVNQYASRALVQALLEVGARHDEADGAGQPVPTAGKAKQAVGSGDKHHATAGHANAVRASPAMAAPTMKNQHRGWEDDTHEPRGFTKATEPTLAP